MGVIDLVLPPTQVGRALWIAIVAAATLVAVWTFQFYGVTPCELCHAERYAFYAGAPLTALAAYLASRSMHGAARALFAILALIFLANAGLAIYHVGVEQHWWAGPTACTGSLSGPVDVNDLVKSLDAARIVRCDEVQLRILGLSLAGWNGVLSAALAIYAALAVMLRR
jgi:disulfide bond formation protein DsbB